MLRYELSPRTLFLAAAMVGGIWLLFRLWPILLVVISALIMMGTLTPAISALEKKRFSRKTAMAIVFSTVALGFVAVAVLLLPPLWRQPSSVHGRCARHPDASGGDGSSKSWDTPGPVVRALYLIADRDRARGALYALVPRDYHIRLTRIVANLETIVGGYMRGQLITSFAIGVFVFALLTLLKVPGAFPLAAIAVVRGGDKRVRRRCKNCEALPRSPTLPKAFC